MGCCGSKIEPEETIEADPVDLDELAEQEGVTRSPVPGIFTSANFQFTTWSDGTAGSLYFESGGNTRRIRLIHSHGPAIGSNHDNNTQFFPKDSNMIKASEYINDGGVVVAWLWNFRAGGSNDDPISTTYAEGRNLVEIFSGKSPFTQDQVQRRNDTNDPNIVSPTDIANGHVSRGKTKRITITQNDINNLYFAINDLKYNTKSKNKDLKNFILKQDLSAVLRQ